MCLDMIEPHPVRIAINAFDKPPAVAVRFSNNRDSTTMWEDVRSLGKRRPVKEVAVSQTGQVIKVEDVGQVIKVEDVGESNDSRVGRILDGGVEVAGSGLFFGVFLVIIVGWAVVGGILRAPDLWQILFQNVSSIQCYISDMVLMRQQLNDTREHLCMIAILRSRSQTLVQCFRILLQEKYHHHRICEKRGSGQIMELASSTKLHEGKVHTVPYSHMMHDIESAAQTTTEIREKTYWYDGFIVVVAEILGSIWMLGAFLLGILAWIALGPVYNWSNSWQLWLNTCTALQQTLTSLLLTLARNRHTAFVDICMHEIMHHDEIVEHAARKQAGFDGDNPPIEISWDVSHGFERFLDWYAAFVGSGYMVVLSFVLLGAWLGIGTPLAWGDNWWLIIGTFSGLVGTLNASVLRYSMFRSEKVIEREYDALAEQDSVMYDMLSLPFPNQVSQQSNKGVMIRTSLFFSRICATSWSVIGTMSLIVGLVLGATVVLWNESAQLLVNSVTMIVESFLLLVLISAHNIQASQHRTRLHDILIRRMDLLTVIDQISMLKCDTS